MDFSVSGSDLWDSTPSQDVFIKGYFRDAGTSPSKTTSKKKRHNLGQKNFGGPEESTTHVKVEKSDKVNKKSPNSQNASKKFKKSKPSENSLSCSETQTFNLKKSVSNSSRMSGKSSTITNNSKSKKVTFATAETPVTELDSSAKEKKIKVSMTKQKKNKVCHESESNILSEDGDSEGEDDDAIRNELMNTSTYKKLQKLLKLAPHLDPSVDSTMLTEPLTDIDMSMSEDDSELSAESADETTEHSKTLSDVSSHILSDLSSKVFSKNLSNLNSCETEFRPSTSKNNKPKENLLKNKAMEKLKAAKFRYLNEKLYTETGQDAFQYFQDNVEEFEEYHSGYTIQVSKWPMNPVDEIIAQLQPLKKSIVIADLGCGSAKIAEVFSDRVVHSFDLVAVNDSVTACDISKVPLEKESVDVAVFCLSLMGTNLKDYLCEAHRILKIGGTLKIAEVESRVEDLKVFIKNITCLGFALERKNTKHKLFVFLDFQKRKVKLKKSKAPKIVLKPCLYKKR